MHELDHVAPVECAVAIRCRVCVEERVAQHREVGRAVIAFRQLDADLVALANEPHVGAAAQLEHAVNAAGRKLLARPDDPGHGRWR